LGVQKSKHYTEVEAVNQKVMKIFLSFDMLLNKGKVALALIPFMNYVRKRTTNSSPEPNHEDVRGSGGVIPCITENGATRCGLDGPGIESQWGRNFPHPSRPVLGPTQPPVQWVPHLFQG
jgi:hypothetical protein